MLDFGAYKMTHKSLVQCPLLSSMGLDQTIQTITSSQKKKKKISGYNSTGPFASYSRPRWLGFYYDYALIGRSHLKKYGVYI